MFISATTQINNTNVYYYEQDKDNVVGAYNKS